MLFLEYFPIIYRLVSTNLVSYLGENHFLPRWKMISTWVRNIFYGCRNKIALKYFHVMQGSNRRNTCGYWYISCVPSLSKQRSNIIWLYFLIDGGNNTPNVYCICAWQNPLISLSKLIPWELCSMLSIHCSLFLKKELFFVSYFIKVY